MKSSCFQYKIERFVSSTQFHTLYIIRCRNRFLYYSLLYVIFSKNSFSLLSVFGVCRSSEKRVQRYRFSQYPPNFSKIFLKKKRKFSFCLTKREAVTLLNIIGRTEKSKDQVSLQSSNLQNPAQQKRDAKTAIHRESETVIHRESKENSGRKARRL